MYPNLKSKTRKQILYALVRLCSFARCTKPPLELVMSTSFCAPFQIFSIRLTWLIAIAVPALQGEKEA